MTSHNYIVKGVKPLMSLNKEESRRRVLSLYRLWFQVIPSIRNDLGLLVTEKQMKEKLREKFLQNKDIKDIRTIDMLVIKGQMDLNETVYKFKQKNHIMNYFDDDFKWKQNDFISKFLEGKD